MKNAQVKMLKRLSASMLRPRDRADAARTDVRYAPKSSNLGIVEVDASCLYATYRHNRKAVVVETTFQNVEELALNRWLQR